MFTQLLIYPAVYVVISQWSNAKPAELLHVVVHKSNFRSIYVRLRPSTNSGSTCLLGLYHIAREFT